MPPLAKFAQSKREVCRRLNIARPTLDRYAVKEGFPKQTAKGWNVSAIEKFIGSSSSRYELTRGQARALRDAKLFEEIRKLRFENDRKESSLVSIAKLKAAADATVTEAERFTDRRLCAEWPEAVAGLDVAGARQYGRRVKDLLMADLQSLASLWRC